jgi:hypothetical protein
MMKHFTGARQIKQAAQRRVPCSNNTTEQYRSSALQFTYIHSLTTRQWLDARTVMHVMCSFN